MKFHPRAREAGCTFVAGVGVEAGLEKWSRVIVAQVAVTVSYKGLQKSVGHAEVKVNGELSANTLGLKTEVDEIVEVGV